MISLDLPKKGPLFDYFPPKSELRALISIPHSGELIPDEFNPYLTSNKTIRVKDYDTAVDQLLDTPLLQKNGVAVLKSNVARICIDLNRPREAACLYWKTNTQGEELVLDLPSSTEQEKLLATYYDPYFEVLESLVSELKRQRKSTPVPCVDLHSMPSRPSVYHFKKNPKQQNARRPDFCLSDLSGKGARKEYLDAFTKKLEEIRGSQDIRINDPYVGGYVSQFLASLPTESFQLEVNRDLYLDEESRKLILDAKELKRQLTEALVHLFNGYGDQVTSVRN